MNREEEIKRWQASIDDDLLEEAQRPLPRGNTALRWGGLAACLCAAALALALALPGHGAAETEDCGAAPDGSAVYKSFSASAEPEALSATLVLPEGAELAPGDIQPTSRTDEPSADIPESAACTIVLGGHDYDYGAVYADAPMPAPDGNLPEVTWQVGGLTLLLYADGAVGWYDAAAGIQWYCVAWDGGQPLVTAFALMDAQSYTVPTAPEGAAVQGYDLFAVTSEMVACRAFKPFCSASS